MKKLIAAMLALVMTLALVPTAAFAEEALNTGYGTFSYEDTSYTNGISTQGISGPSTIKISAYNGKGLDVISGNKLQASFEYKGSQFGDKTVHILKNGKLTGNASSNTAKADPSIIIENNEVYKFDYAGMGGNYFKRIKNVYWKKVKFIGKQWYFEYFDDISAPVVSEGQVNFVYKKAENNTYILNYDANEGTGAPVSETQNKGSLASATFTISSVAPTREGYKFLGWADSKDAAAANTNYAAGKKLTLTYTSDVTQKTLYAVWEAKENITLTYDANGGTGAPNSETQQVEKGQSAAFTVSAAEPTWENHTFKGWSTSNNATTAEYTGGNSITISQNTTLYAVWEENTTPPTDKPNGPKPEYTSKPFIELTGEEAVKVQCTNDKSHAPKSYGLKFEGYTIGDVQGDEQTGYTCDITVQPDEYVSAYNETYSGHTLVDPSQTGTIKLEWDKENHEWKLATPSDVPVVFTVKCETTPAFGGVITVKKTVESNDPADKTREFKFKVTVMGNIGPGPAPTDPIISAVNAVAAPAAGAANKTATDKDFVEKNGIWTFEFTLRDGDTMTISNLPEGYTYRVEELDAGGYTVTVNDEAASSNDVALTKEKLTETLNFKNAKGSAPTPTPTPGGGHHHYEPTPVPPIIVNPPKTGDMTIWQSILRFLGIK